MKIFTHLGQKQEGGEQVTEVKNSSIIKLFNGFLVVNTCINYLSAFYSLIAI